MTAKKRASGPSGKNLESGFLVRARTEQLKRWRRAADRDRRTLSDWVRVTLDDAAR